MKQAIVILLLVLFATTVSAKAKKEFVEITGVVTELVNGEEKPVPYATVSVKGSTESTFADADGNFFLEVEKGKQDLQFSCFGYETVSKKVKAKASKNETVSISMEMKHNTLVQK